MKKRFFMLMISLMVLQASKMQGSMQFFGKPPLAPKKISVQEQVADDIATYQYLYPQLSRVEILKELDVRAQKSLVLTNDKNLVKELTQYKDLITSKRKNPNLKKVKKQIETSFKSLVYSFVKKS
ncbi:hypothetical protein KBB68_01000 [Candidatus Babeliales bacterium]|nr:hypothetical protein [Candidatus Babeliales bacterium]